MNGILVKSAQIWRIDAAAGLDQAHVNCFFVELARHSQWEDWKGPLQSSRVIRGFSFHDWLV
jgi:hypothetical protein